MTEQATAYPPDPLEKRTRDRFVDECRARGIELGSASAIFSTVQPEYSDASGAPWSDGAGTFNIMCPTTTRPCHSMCACFRPRGVDGEPAGSAADMEARRDPSVTGRCVRFDFKASAF